MIGKCLLVDSRLKCTIKLNAFRYSKFFLVIGKSQGCQVASQDYGKPSLFHSSLSQEFRTNYERNQRRQPLIKVCQILRGTYIANTILIGKGLDAFMMITMMMIERYLNGVIVVKKRKMHCKKQPKKACDLGPLCLRPLQLTYAGQPIWALKSLPKQQNRAKNAKHPTFERNLT